MSIGSDIKISTVSKTHFNVDFTYFKSAIKGSDIHHLCTELLNQYTRAVVTLDSSEIRDSILGVRSMNTTKDFNLSPT
jgi:glutathione peroxidase-family protein